MFVFLNSGQILGLHTAITEIVLTTHQFSAENLKAEHWIELLSCKIYKDKLKCLKKSVRKNKSKEKQNSRLPEHKTFLCMGLLLI